MPATIAPQAEAELARRELARRHLARFLRYRFRQEGRRLLWNWHLDYLCEVLEAVTQREDQVRFTIINIPPGHLKSELVSQTWQAWMIGRSDSDDSSVLSASNSAALSERDSRKTMEICQSFWFAQVFPRFGVDDDGKPRKWRKELVTEWETPGGAKRETIGALSGGTGWGAGRLIWDDILAAAMANSDTVRTRTNAWLGETFRTRLRDQKRGTITGIMQRLHEEDPTGFLLKQQRMPGADQYYHICLEEECSRRKVYTFGDFFYERAAGELLFPAMIDRKALRGIKIAMRANYSGQFNQRPTKQEGNLLKPAKLVRIDKPAEQIATEWNLRLVFYLDFASKEKQTQKDDPDYSVIGVMGRDALQRIHLVDLFREQCTHERLAEQLIAMHRKWRPIAVKGERGALLNAFQSTLSLVGRNPKHARRIWLEEISAPGDKVARAAPLVGVINTGSFCVPANAHWLPDLEHEWRSFPNGPHDDQVDVPAYGVLDFEAMVTRPPQPRPPVPERDLTDPDARAHIADLVRRGKVRMPDDEDDK